MKLHVYGSAWTENKGSFVTAYFKNKKKSLSLNIIEHAI